MHPPSHSFLPVSSRPSSNEIRLQSRAPEPQAHRVNAAREATVPIMTTASTPEYRVTIPAKDDVEPETARLLEFVDRPPRGPIPTVAVLAHTAPLFGPFLGWASAIALEGALPKRDHELVALRAIHHSHSEFERVEHSEFARDLGITEVELARLDLDDGADAPEWAEHEAALLHAVDELATGCSISDPTWAQLARHYSPGQLVEIPFVAGQYTMLSMVANALEIGAWS
jgi:alkylhydroperoxidase family enzyme